MFKLICIILVLLICCYCVTPVKKHAHIDNTIRSIVVSEIIPFPNKNEKFTIYDTLSIPIYYYQGLIAYKLVYRLDSLDNSGNLIGSQNQYHFFIYKKGDVFGYFYDSFNSNVTIKVLADSMLKHGIWCEVNNLYSGFIDNNIKLVARYKNKDSGTLHEFYVYSRKNDSTMNGTFSLSFSDKIKGIEYSLSKELDSLKGMKLYNVKMEGHIQYQKNGKIIYDTLRTVDDLKEIIVTDSEEILQYFTRYKKDCLKKD
ncbi:MAG: hypothetical protein ABIN74_05815 [Ferruginibacter sp.]